MQVPSVPPQGGQPTLSPEEQQKLLDSSELGPTDAEESLLHAGTGGRAALPSGSGGVPSRPGALYEEEQRMLHELGGIYGSVDAANGLQLHELLDIMHVRRRTRQYFCSFWGSTA
jgi:hypothetical protein